MISALLLWLSLSTGQLFAEEYPSNFWGYRQVNQTLRDRLFVSSSPFRLYTYLGTEKLTELLGFQPTAHGAEFRNGLPNSTNVLLWAVTMELFSTDIASVCDKGSSELGLNDEFATSLLEFCKWPSTSVRHSDFLETIWLAVMNYDAPFAEFEAWRDFVLNEHKQSEPKAAIKDALFTILMNPHFLVRK